MTFWLNILFKNIYFHLGPNGILLKYDTVLVVVHYFKLSRTFH